jgi:hypothetical protein
LVEDGKLSELAKNVRIYPKPTFTDSTIGNRFDIDGNTIGRVTRIINWTTLEVSPFTNDKGENIGFDKPIILKIEDADAVNYAYTYGSYDEFGMPTNNSHVSSNANTKELSVTAKSIIRAIEADDEDDEVDEISIPKESIDISAKIYSAIEGSISEK